MEIFLAMTYAGLRSLPFLFLIYYPFRHELRLPDWCVVAFTVVLALIDGMQCAGFVSINNLEPLLYAGQLSFAVLVIRTALCKKLFFICLSIFMERFFYIVIHILTGTFPAYPPLAMETGGYFLLLCLIGLAISHVFFRYDMTLSNVTDERHWWIACLIGVMACLSTVIALMVIHWPFFQLIPVADLLLLAPGGGSLFLAAYFLLTRANVNKLSANLALVEKISATERNYYRTVVQTDQLSHNIIKNLQNHCTEIYAMALRQDGKALADYLQQHFSYLEDTAQLVVQSGNAMVDSIAGYWLMEARARGIKVFCQVQLKDMQFSDMDLAVLLGNALENAVEAAALCDKPARQLHFMMETRYNSIVLMLRNSYTGRLVIRDDVYYSSKRDFKEAGIGISSIRHIVEKNKGMMKIKTDAKEFCLSILMFQEKGAPDDQ